MLILEDCDIKTMFHTNHNLLKFKKMVDINQKDFLEAYLTD